MIWWKHLSVWTSNQSRETFLCDEFSCPGSDFGLYQLLVEISGYLVANAPPCSPACRDMYVSAVWWRAGTALMLRNETLNQNSWTQTVLVLCWFIQWGYTFHILVVRRSIVKNVDYISLKALWRRSFHLVQNWLI